MFSFLHSKKKINNRPTKERTIMLENYLGELKKINGYKGAALADFTGEIIVSDTSGLEGDLGMVAATLNDIFRFAHTATKDLGLGTTSLMTINAQNSSVLMECSGENERMHLHLTAIFSQDGNQALAKMTMKKILPQIVNELAG